VKEKHTIDDWTEAFFAIDRNLKTRIKYLKKFDINNKSKILEIACSDGVNLDALSTIGYDNIIGVDISFDLLSKAKRYPLICSDVYNLGIREKSIDEVYCRGFLHHIDDVQGIINELSRILRPGGVIHFLEPWPTFFRKIADILNLNILYLFSKTLYYRRIIILSEWKLYSYWLKTCKKTLFESIKNSNMIIIYKQVSLFDIYISVKKLVK